MPARQPSFKARFTSLSSPEWNVRIATRPPGFKAPGDGAWWGALCVYYNPTEEEQRVWLPGGNWKLLSDGTSSSLWRGSSRVVQGQAVLAPVSATIFGLV